MRMPVLFLAHGSPLNAIHDNSFTRFLKTLSAQLPIPKAILCISAHWLTNASFLTSAAKPRMIYDMTGFPEELYRIQYPAPGDPALAQLICDQIKTPQLRLDQEKWGFDHGTWSLLVHLYPQATIPVIQLSLDMTQPNIYHYRLGEKLKFLRDQGVLILGSGNIVHNLRTIEWDENAQALPWAIEFDTWVKTKLQNGETNSLVQEYSQLEFAKLSVPAVDHYLPFLVAMGASEHDDELQFIYEGFQNASISMSSFSFGLSSI